MGATLGVGVDRTDAVRGLGLAGCSEVSGRVKNWPGAESFLRRLQKRFGFDVAFSNVRIQVFIGAWRPRC
jgi:hypothetical protein